MNLGRSARVGIAGIALLLGVSAGPLAGHSYAQSAVCRTDPILTLSNGAKLNLWAVTQTSSTSITGVYYTVHIPWNLTVKSTIYDAYGYLEHVTVKQDMDAGNYVQTTVVTGKSGPVFDTYINVNGVNSQSQDSVVNIPATVDWSG